MSYKYLQNKAQEHIISYLNSKREPGIIFEKGDSVTCPIIVRDNGKIIWFSRNSSLLETLLNSNFLYNTLEIIDCIIHVFDVYGLKIHICTSDTTLFTRQICNQITPLYGMCKDIAFQCSLSINNYRITKLRVNEQDSISILSLCLDPINCFDNNSELAEIKGNISRSILAKVYDMVVKYWMLGNIIGEYVGINDIFQIIVELFID